jgi:hypothetical protein
VKPSVSGKFPRILVLAQHVEGFVDAPLLASPSIPRDKNSPLLLGAQAYRADQFRTNGSVLHLWCIEDSMLPTRASQEISRRIFEKNGL